MESEISWMNCENGEQAKENIANPNAEEFSGKPDSQKFSFGTCLRMFCASDLSILTGEDPEIRYDYYDKILLTDKSKGPVFGMKTEEYRERLFSLQK